MQRFTNILYKKHFGGGIMKRSIALWQFFGFAVTALGGTVLHFLYEWLGEATWIAPFAGVNESTWEHMKLLFWPTFIYAVIESLFFRKRGDFWCVKLRGILLGLALIPFIFYTYIGVIGKSPDFVNIAIFFIAAAIAYIYEFKLFKNQDVICKKPNIAFCTLCVMALLFVVFTFWPPRLNIFLDPVTNRYGI